jgi:hypothetical protein
VEPKASGLSLILAAAAGRVTDSLASRLVRLSGLKTKGP